ncbi:hypothetical protein ACSSS7_006893 [Eimeria intestinalis]
MGALQQPALRPTGSKGPTGEKGLAAMIQALAKLLQQLTQLQELVVLKTAYRGRHYSQEAAVDLQLGCGFPYGLRLWVRGGGRTHMLAYGGGLGERPPSAEVASGFREILGGGEATRELFWEIAQARHGDGGFAANQGESSGGAQAPGKSEGRPHVDGRVGLQGGVFGYSTHGGQARAGGRRVVTIFPAAFKDVGIVFTQRVDTEQCHERSAQHEDERPREVQRAQAYIEADAAEDPQGLVADTQDGRILWRVGRVCAERVEDISGNERKAAVRVYTDFALYASCGGPRSGVCPRASRSRAAPGVPGGKRLAAGEQDPTGRRTNRHSARGLLWRLVKEERPAAEVLDLLHLAGWGGRAIANYCFDVAAVKPRRARVVVTEMMAAAVRVDLDVAESGTGYEILAAATSGAAEIICMATGAHAREGRGGKIELTERRRRQSLRRLLLLVVEGGGARGFGRGLKRSRAEFPREICAWERREMAAIVWTVSRRGAVLDAEAPLQEAGGSAGFGGHSVQPRQLAREGGEARGTADAAEERAGEA